MTDRASDFALAALRFGAFVCAAALFVIAYDLTHMPALALGVATFAITADAMFAVLGGARGRVLAMSIATGTTVWIALGLGVALPYDNFILAQPSLGWLTLAVGIAAIVALPRTQALWMWTLTSLWAATSLFGASPLLGDLGSASPQAVMASMVGGSSSTGPSVVDVTALCLAGSSIGVLGYYLHEVVRQRCGWRQLAARLSLLGLTVGLAVVVAGTAAIRVGRIDNATNLALADITRNTFAVGVAQSVSASYSSSALASPTPNLERDLARFGALGRVGLSICDLQTGRVTIAIRRLPLPKSILPSAALAPAPGASSLDAFASPSLSGAERTAAESLTGDIPDPSAIFARGVLPPHAIPLGFRDGSAFQLARDSLEATSQLVAEAPPNGERFRLVVSEPTDDWIEPSGYGADELGRELGAQLAPWLLFAFMLPCVLGLMAIDRRDEVRGRLAAAEERARLNRDAHDRVYNRLTALANQLAAAQSADTPIPAPAEEIRRTVSDLQAILGDGAAARHADGVDAAARLLADVTADQARVWSMDVTLEGAEALLGIDPRVGWELACIAEEALTNAGKHGRAKRARVRLSTAGGTLTLEVADSGRGIAGPLAADGLPSNASGMRGMRDRTSVLGGTLAVETGPGGVVITARIPTVRT